MACGDFAKLSSWMGEGGVGLGVRVNNTAPNTREHQNPLPQITLLRTRETLGLGSITPILTRPHRGGGNTLAIGEYNSPQRRRGEGEGAACTNPI
jgi:hypothetical protein